MFSGLNEIILIVFVAVAVIFLPGFFSKRQGRNNVTEVAKRKKLSWQIRLAVMFSIIWAAGAAFIFRPWDNEPVNFVLYGVAPLLACAGIAWVVQGYRSGR